ncbi:MAG TPA: His/Gly/Thr/Pro-type tRNA ligase C-terminal domain-containing protein, partial [Clostridia bacterium]|nr:His/Gly/Thr/Pro-type tRNA ligase C-terminal domain-containing protein [Clostridia bacterium]
LGICWPEKISPYDFHVLVLNSKKEDQVALGEKVAEELSSVGIDVILDDRPERAGFKFKDCELLGIPKIVVVGKNASEEIVEYRDRRMGSETIMKYEELVKLANH